MASFKWGFFIAVLILCSLLIVFALFSLLIERRVVEDNLYLANAAVYTTIDIETIRDNNEMRFADPAASLSFFKKALQNSFSLDNNLNPTSNTPKMIAGQLEVLTLSLKNENMPATLGWADVNNNTAVYSVVKVPLKVVGLNVTVTSTVHSLTILPKSY